ncbi:MAG: hypothetical protein EB127_13120 [Alphaproteobacteria bacterium]|nr:hypothetical protein [Alphaproteobacteria bacterium]
MIVKRDHVKKDSGGIRHTGLVDIWDCGSHRYERWPDGVEYFWKIISRDLIPGGFSETLEKMPEWLMPGQVLYQQAVPLYVSSNEEFHLGEWSVRQHTLNVPVVAPQASQKPSSLHKSTVGKSKNPYVNKREAHKSNFPAYS